MSIDPILSGPIEQTIATKSKKSIIDLLITQTGISPVSNANKPEQMCEASNVDTGQPVAKDKVLSSIMQCLIKIFVNIVGVNHPAVKQLVSHKDINNLSQEQIWELLTQLGKEIFGSNDSGTKLSQLIGVIENDNIDDDALKQTLNTIFTNEQYPCDVVDDLIQEVHKIRDEYKKFLTAKTVKTVSAEAFDDSRKSVKSKQILEKMFQNNSLDNNITGYNIQSSEDLLEFDAVLLEMLNPNSKYCIDKILTDRVSVVKFIEMFSRTSYYKVDNLTTVALDDYLKHFSYILPKLIDKVSIDIVNLLLPNGNVNPNTDLYTINAYCTVFVYINYIFQHLNNLRNDNALNYAKSQMDTKFKAVQFALQKYFDQYPLPQIPKKKLVDTCDSPLAMCISCVCANGCIYKKEKSQKEGGGWADDSVNVFGDKDVRFAKLRDNRVCTFNDDKYYLGKDSALYQAVFKNDLYVSRDNDNQTMYKHMTSIQANWESIRNKDIINQINDMESSINALSNIIFGTLQDGAKFVQLYGVWFGWSASGDFCYHDTMQLCQLQRSSNYTFGDYQLSYENDNLVFDKDGEKYILTKDMELSFHDKKSNVYTRKWNDLNININTKSSINYLYDTTNKVYNLDGCLYQKDSNELIVVTNDSYQYRIDTSHNVYTKIGDSEYNIYKDTDGWLWCSSIDNANETQYCLHNGLLTMTNKDREQRKEELSQSNALQAYNVYSQGCHRDSSSYNTSEGMQPLVNLLPDDRYVKEKNFFSTVFKILEDVNNSKCDYSSYVYFGFKFTQSDIATVKTGLKCLLRYKQKFDLIYDNKKIPSILNEQDRQDLQCFIILTATFRSLYSCLYPQSQITLNEAFECKYGHYISDINKDKPVNFKDILSGDKEILQMMRLFAAPLTFNVACEIQEVLNSKTTNNSIENEPQTDNSEPVTSYSQLQLATEPIRTDLTWKDKRQVIVDNANCLFFDNNTLKGCHMTFNELLDFMKNNPNYENYSQEDKTKRAYKDICDLFIEVNKNRNEFYALNEKAKYDFSYLNYMFRLPQDEKFNYTIPDEYFERIKLLIQSTTDDHLRKYFELILKSYDFYTKIRQVVLDNDTRNHKNSHYNDNCLSDLREIASQFGLQSREDFKKTYLTKFWALDCQWEWGQIRDKLYPTPDAKHKKNK